VSTLTSEIAASSSLTARADDAWPTSLVRLISPYRPGGSNDISLRLLAEEFSRSLRQHSSSRTSRCRHPHRQRHRRPCARRWLHAATSRPLRHRRGAIRQADL